MSWKSLGFDSYSDYLNSTFWKDKREWILECYEYTCQSCRSKKNLQIHHTNYFNIGNEGRDDVTVLCKKCHKKEHDRLNEEKGEDGKVRC